MSHNLLGLHHVAEFKLAPGSLASAFLTKPAGFQDLRTAFFRLWETWVSADWEAGLCQRPPTPPPGKLPLLQVW